MSRMLRRLELTQLLFVRGRITAVRPLGQWFQAAVAFPPSTELLLQALVGHFVVAEVLIRPRQADRAARALSRGRTRICSLSPLRRCLLRRHGKSGWGIRDRCGRFERQREAEKRGSERA